MIGLYVQFTERGEVRQGVVIEPVCRDDVYILPLDRPDFPRLASKESVVILENITI